MTRIRWRQISLQRQQRYTEEAVNATLHQLTQQRVSSCGSSTRTRPGPDRDQTRTTRRVLVHAGPLQEALLQLCLPGRLADGGRMLWLLLSLLPMLGYSRILSQHVAFKDGHDRMEVAVTTRPHIYNCRSPNMEDFTCWWHPLDNLTEGEEATYVLTYSKNKGPARECPDYVTAGPNSCYFNSNNTCIWKMYCMNVTAVTARGNFTSQERCLDVADIVQTEAPVNLAYTLKDAGGDELGHNVLLSWTYPVPSHVKYGWITLVYELQYRRANELDKWKAKHSLREPHVKLLGLPVGDYVIRVRCRSHNYGLWSEWSATLQMSIPSRVPAGKLLVLILVTGVGVVALLVIAFSVLPQSRRFKDYFLPQIPKPRIIGIDPLFLKKGNLDEINRHFGNFHSYKPPSYTEEVWDQVSADGICHPSATTCSEPADPTQRDRDALMLPNDLTPVAAHHQPTTPNPSSYVQSPSPYCSSPPQLLDTPSPEMVSLPGTDYTVLGHPESVPAPDATAGRSPQDLYTCVQLMNESGEVHLMPCVPLPYCQEFPPPSKVDLDQAEKEEKKKQANYMDRKNVTREDNGGDEAERSDATVPLLPVALGNKG